VGKFLSLAYDNWAICQKCDEVYFIVVVLVFFWREWIVRVRMHYYYSPNGVTVREYSVA